MIPLKDTLLKHDAIIHIEYYIQNRLFNLTTRFIDTSVSNEHITVKKQLLIDNDISFDLGYTIEPDNTDNQNIKLKTFEILFKTNLTNQVMLAEGFQCWSQTKEVDKTTTIRSIQSAVAWVTKFNLQGDYNFYKYSNKQGLHHSTGYTYFRNTQDDDILFIGSLTESNGYSYFKSDFKKNHFSIYKDVEGKNLASGEKMAFSYFITQHDDGGNQTILWQRYAEHYLPMIHVDPKEIEKVPSLTGYTTWYVHYEDVTEKDVISSIEGFKKYGYPVELIQIDDGYESAIGDWLDVTESKFPHGMKYLADEIKQQTKAIPGIWLAPFAVGLNSKICKQHPDWLVYQTNNGEPYLAGPNWGGFYALDIYHPEVRDYLQQVFDTVIDDWGYQFLKLDFIFAAAMVPRLGKSRGEIMWDAVDLILELTKKRAYLLGSGITLPSVWGRMAYSRVSSDASPWWDHSVLRISHVRERVATANALISTINRWGMNNQMFGNDPDVYFIRSFKNQLTVDERFTLVTINNLFGKMTLMSDNVNWYTKEEHALYSQLFPKVQVTIKYVKLIGPDIYQIHFISNDRSYITFTNLSPQPFTFHLPTTSSSSSISASIDYHEFIYFEHKNRLLTPLNNDPLQLVDWYKVINHQQKQPSFLLRPHETRTFMEINEKDEFVGSTSHLISGWELASIKKDGEKQDLIYIQLRQPRTNSNTIQLYFKASSSFSENHKIFINDKKINDIQKLDNKTSFPILKLTYSP
ncbi:unnamed protein product [Cunninghamella blakesleeana]